ncbi:hypothetical protein [Streptomyces mirabilis]|uniref:hypothetical protein n=1 Tax=Streptomyces mirabilis TaxID=68239 RepID=UPI0033331A16
MSPNTTTKSCACDGRRVCLAHYSALTPHGKRAAQMDAGINKGAWLVADKGKPRRQS